MSKKYPGNVSHRKQFKMPVNFVETNCLRRGRGERVYKSGPFIIFCVESKTLKGKLGRELPTLTCFQDTKSVISNVQSGDFVWSRLGKYSDRTNLIWPSTMLFGF